MSPEGPTAKGGEEDANARRRINWRVLRQVICDRYFKGRGEECCADCEDRIVCFRMIEDALDFVDGLKQVGAVDKDRP